MYNPANYEETDRLVREYQDGDPDKGEELLRKFDPFIKKYLDIIKRNKIKMKDKDTKKFLSLFMSNKEDRKEIYRPTKEAKKLLYNMSEFLGKICSNLTEEDMEQELQLVLLTLANRFEKREERKTFAGYVYNAFRYEIYRKIISYSKDPLTFSYGDNLTYNDFEYENDESDFKLDPKLYAESPVLGANDGTLDNDWVMGNTCKDEFLNLNEFERLILKLSYQDEIPDTEIQNIIGIHRHTIREKRKEALKILREVMTEKYGYDERELEGEAN